MAEFLQQGTQALPDVYTKGSDGFAQMGKSIPLYRRDAGLQHCRSMGLTDTAQAMACVDQMASQLERDEPYRAMAAGMRFLDLTGTYRLMAVLLTAPKPRVRIKANALR